MASSKIKKYILKICKASYDASKITRTLSNLERNKILTVIINELKKKKTNF